MDDISAEALRRFKRTDLYEILDDAERRYNQLSEDEQDKLRQFIADYPDIDDLYSRIESQSSMINRWLELHREYLASREDADFTTQEIQEHNEFIDDLFLNFIFLGEKIETFPPRPVLPPPAPLIKISGVIEEVEFTKAMACFEAEAYSTVRDELERKRQQDNIGALVAMTVQALAGTPPHAMINDGQPRKLKCLYVKGKIDGKVFSGWFGMTNIRPGDKVEMAVMPDGDGYLAYAIINLSRKTISMTPECNDGKSSNAFHLTALFFFVVFFIPFIFPFLYANAFLTTLCVYVSVSLFISVGVYKQTQNKKGAQFDLYERIADVLGFPGGERFQLTVHSARILNEKEKNGEYYLRKEGDVPMPQRASDGFSHEFFYYYMV
ncbi:putative type VI secretion system effector [Pantoea sp. FN060301]|uniref:putative type VI secretion system effector n=1 Tax=Pantoea sp. FN060301 TaxID=3420380 RepID=UPI003D186247